MVNSRAEGVDSGTEGKDLVGGAAQSLAAQLPHCLLVAACPCLVSTQHMHLQQTKGPEGLHKGLKGQIHPSATLVRLGQNAVVSEYQSTILLYRHKHVYYFYH
jgi:hypothetical protein